MKSMNFYKERVVESLNEGFSHKKGSKNPGELFKGLREGGNYQKMATLVRIINEIMPDAASTRILEMLPKGDLSQLPFDPNKLDFKWKIGRGGEHEIFLLESMSAGIPSYVLKINHQNIGSFDQIQKEAIEFKKEYEEIRQRYSSMPGIVPDELTMIISDPKTRKPIMATIQKYQGTEIRDLLNDFKREELVQLLVDNPKLLDDFQKFCEITEKEYELNGVAVDLLGDKNLSIVKDGGRLKLLILDPHCSVLKVNDKVNRTKEQEAFMGELKKILERAKGI